MEERSDVSGLLTQVQVEASTELNGTFMGGILVRMLSGIQFEMKDSFHLGEQIALNSRVLSMSR